MCRRSNSYSDFIKILSLPFQPIYPWCNMKTLMNLSTPNSLWSSKQFEALHQAYGREIIVRQIPQSFQRTCQLKTVLSDYEGKKKVFCYILEIIIMNFKYSGGIILYLFSIQPFFLNYLLYVWVLQECKCILFMWVDTRDSLWELR